MKLFVSTLLITTASLASAKASIAHSAQKIPRVPFYGTTPGVSHHGLVQDTSSIPVGPPSKASHWLSVRFPLDNGHVIVTPLMLPRITDGQPEDVIRFEEKFLIALDAISRSRDPLAKSISLARWTHFAAIDHRQLAELHDIQAHWLVNTNGAIQEREQERFYQKLAFYFEILIDSLLADDEFMSGFAVSEGLRDSAQQSYDDVLAKYIYHLDHQFVSVNRLRAKLEKYLLVRKIAKLPVTMRGKFVYLSEMLAVNNEPLTVALGFAARRALMRDLHSSMGLAITERVNYVNRPSSIGFEEMSKYVGIDSRLWRKIYLLQKNTNDVFSSLHNSRERIVQQQ